MRKLVTLPLALAFVAGFLFIVETAPAVAGTPTQELAQRGQGGMGGGGMGGGERRKRGGRKGGGDGSSQGPSEGAGEGEPPADWLPGRVRKNAVDEAVFCGLGRFKRCNSTQWKARGLFETGLRPRFPEGLKCRDIDEQYAIDYSANRGGRDVVHGGIDMPAPWGVPMLAVADGTVVTKTVGDNSYRGKEIIIRHSPDDTGLPFWTYSQYAHFDEMPSVEVGDRVKMGQKLGPTGNSGRGKDPWIQSDKRRPAIHFAVWYSEKPEYVVARTKVIPVEGWWMDPNALYRKAPPYDSAGLKALPEDEKTVDIPVMLADGTTVPADTKVVWPYACER